MNSQLWGILAGITQHPVSQLACSNNDGCQDNRQMSMIQHKQCEIYLPDFLQAQSICLVLCSNSFPQTELFDDLLYLQTSCMKACLQTHKHTKQRDNPEAPLQTSSGRHCSRKLSVHLHRRTQNSDARWRYNSFGHSMGSTCKTNPVRKDLQGTALCHWQRSKLLRHAA